MIRISFLVVISVISGLSVSCSDHDHSGHDHGSGDSHMGDTHMGDMHMGDMHMGDMHMGDMHTNLEPDTYAEGMEKMSANGSFMVRLDMSSPAPKDTGKYTWNITVLDMEGSPVTDAVVKAEPTMPQHGHGTDPQFTEATAGAEDGQHVLTDMNLFMPGIWQISIMVTSGDTMDSASFLFDLEG